MKLKAYQDKTTGLWKWGTRGKAIHETKIAAERYGINALTEGLLRARERHERELLNYGR